MQIHFEQPKNAYTQETILVYQKEQQNKPAYKVGTDEFKYFPSGVDVSLNFYNN